MKFVFTLIELAFIKSVLLYRVYHSLPVVELKRRARAKDRRAADLYKVATYIDSLDVLLWLVGVASFVVIAVWAVRTAWWLALIAVLAADILMRRPNLFTADNWAGGLAALAAKPMASALSFLNPVFGRLSSWLPSRQSHTSLYERKDMLELLARQTKQADSRIEPSDLHIAAGAMTFGDKLVRDFMTPRRQIRFVKADETVGPMLMDELHKTGHSRFPVTKDNPKMTSPQITGTLYLKDIIDMQAGGKVKDYTRKDAYYINQDSNLRQALGAFLKTQHHQLVVVNNSEEIVGVLSIEDVFGQIIGESIKDESDSYDSLRAAAKGGQTGRKNHNESEVAPEPK